MAKKETPLDTVRRLQSLIVDRQNELIELKRVVKSMVENLEWSDKDQKIDE